MEWLLSSLERFCYSIRLNSIRLHVLVRRAQRCPARRQVCCTRSNLTTWPTRRVHAQSPVYGFTPQRAELPFVVRGSWS